MSKNNTAAKKSAAPKVIKDEAPKKAPAVKKEETKFQDHTVTEEDLELNPELAERGVKIGDVIQIPVVVEKPKDEPVKKADKNKKLDDQMEVYAKAYPGETSFLVSSDGQVFLNANAMDAKTHQKSLDNTKELVEYFV